MPSILLVADDAWVRNDVKAALTDPGITLVDCDDPASAAELAGAQQFDAIVVDMQIKSMGGMAVIRSLRDAIANDAVPSIPIVLLLDRRADVFLAKRAGADAHLLKPFTAQDLRLVLEHPVG
jgi:DNA-binding response OmpR family regulator